MLIPVELLRRQSPGAAQFGDVKNTFSSWDTCMSKNYCKWPVIAVIVVGSLIVLSLLFCLARCLCCGLECCCGICACCNACCPSPRRKRDRGAKYSKHADSPAAPAAHPGGWNPASYFGGYQPAPQAPTYPSVQPPQYAHFDSAPAGGATRGDPGIYKPPTSPDALPHMPSWDNAAQRQVPHGGDAMEMGRMGGGDEAVAPMLSHQAPEPYGGAAAAAGGYRGHTPTGGSRSTTPQPPGGGHHDASTAYGGAGDRHLPGSLSAGGYAPSVTSTKYEPTSYHGGQESGTAYSAYRPPPQQGWKDI